MLARAGGGGSSMGRTGCPIEGGQALRPCRHAPTVYTEPPRPCDMVKTSDDDATAAALNRIGAALERLADAKERQARGLEASLEIEKIRAAQGHTLNESMQALAGVAEAGRGPGGR